MFKWIKKHSYWALAIAILLVAVVAIGAYAWYFRKMEIVTDTGKWADFATYLSGTVGVAAVVATLIAFLITLRQQNALIKSQDEQLEISRNQLQLAASKEIVEKAYSNSANVLPLIIEALIERSKRKLPHFLSYEKPAIWSCARAFLTSDFFDVVEKPIVLRTMLGRSEVSYEYVDMFVEELFSEVRDICLLAFDQIDSSPVVYYIFDSYLKKVVGENKNVRFFVRCYYSYKLGVGDHDFCQKVSDFLKVERRDAGVEFEWLGLGEQIKKAND